MDSYRSHSLAWVVALLAVAALSICRLDAQVNAGTDSSLSPAADLNAPPPAPSQEQPEVLSRGPVHEAFAEPVAIQPQEGLIAPQQPPPPIKEVPPADKPQGSQFVWIPGYWSWDADRSGYIWVSACWRAAPPNMSWVPGYWSQVPGGWEWVAGFWAPAGVQNIEYLPAPPVIEDIEPVGLQPSLDMIWVPPCMYWCNDRYVRRAGYWLRAQPNWVWVPSHYVLTPRGCIFAEGYWDYSLDRRGVLFAPVYFPASVYLRAGFTFSPGIVIDTGLLQVSLFAYPRYSHYYFGDYYDGAYLSIGIFPWFESRHYRTWYDPIYEHARWQNRSSPRWEDRERDEYRRRFDDKRLRPAHTFREQESRPAGPQRHASPVVQPIERTVTGRQTPLKFERINPDTRQTISRQANEVHTFSNERNRWESPAAAPKTVQPVEDHKTTVMPLMEHRQTARPQRGSTVTAPASQRESTFTVPRETQVSRPERVKIPVSPVIGGSGRQGFFYKGPPTKPSNETTDNTDIDNRRK